MKILYYVPSKKGTIYFSLMANLSDIVTSPRRVFSATSQLAFNPKVPTVKLSREISFSSPISFVY